MQHSMRRNQLKLLNNWMKWSKRKNLKFLAQMMQQGILAKQFIHQVNNLLLCCVLLIKRIKKKKKHFTMENAISIQLAVLIIFNCNSF